MGSSIPNSNQSAPKSDPDKREQCDPDKREPTASDLSDERKARIYELLDDLDKASPVFEDESIAPEVAHEVLLALARGELPDDQARLIYRLVYTFKSWRDAHAEILIKELHKRPK